MSSTTDKFLMIIGTLASAITGFAVIMRAHFVGVAYEILSSYLVSDDSAKRMDYRNSGNSTFVRLVPSEVGTVESMAGVGVGFIVLSVVNCLSAFLQITTWEYVCQNQVNRIRSRFFDKALKLEVSWHDQMEKYDDLITRLTDDIEKMRNDLGSKVTLATSSLATLVSAIIYVAVTNWILGIIITIGSILGFALVVVSGKITSSLASKEQENSREIGYIATEVLTSLKIVKSFGRENSEIYRFERAIAAGKEISRKKHLIAAIQFALIASLIYVVVALVVGIGGYMISVKMTTIAVLVSAVGCFRMGTSTFSNILPFFNDLSETISACKNTFDFFDLPVEIDVASSRGIVVENLQGDVIFSDVTFSYPTRKDTQVLKQFNLKIPNGKTVALVGASGSGKSTILSLITRFFNPVSGKITIGGKDIKDMNVNSLRKKMGVVSQEPVLFDGTIEDNIRYGNLEASFKEIRAAAELASAHTFITKLPQGYSTLVGERGSMLSGGQKQRIVIARALVRNPDIWLLDEATSALDRNSEVLVQSTLDRILKGKTAVVIAHRLTAVRNADIIHVMKEGTIVETGNHDALMRKQGAYFSLAKQQNEEERNELESNYERRLSVRPTEDRRFSFNRKSSIMSQFGLPISIAEDNEEESPSLFVNEKSHKVSWASLMRLSKLWMIILATICYVLYGLYTPAYSYLFSLSAVEAAALPLSQIYSNFFTIALHLVYLAAALFVVYFPGSLCAALALIDTVGALRLNMFKSALNQKFAYFDNPKTSPTSVANDIIQKPVQFKNIGGMKAGELLGVISFAVTAFAMSYAMFWQIALVQSIFIPVVILLNWIQIRVKLVAQKKKNAYLRKSSKLAAICFDNIKAVHYLSLQEHLLDKYNDFWKDETKEQMATIFFSAGTFAVGMAIPNFLSCINFWLGFYWVTQGLGSVGSLAVDNPLFLMVFTMVGGVTIYFEQVSSSKASVGEAINIMNLPRDGDEQQTQKVTPDIKGKIEFKNVFFSYPTDSKPVLKGLSLTIESGLVVALVGSSGCGKSTTISLLEKFYECDEGKLLIDGVDIKDIRTDHIRAAISLVTQEPLLFNTSIRENLLYGVSRKSDEITQEDIERVCKQANIHHFISKLPEGYETNVGARGSQLSGGQKQRIAIARALLRNPKILLLDEATSALDTESEMEVQTALNEASKGRTTIMIAHRLSTVKNANLIVVLDNGQLTEKGTHEELVALKGKYYEMVMK